MRARVFIGSSSSPDRMRTTMALAHRLQKDFGVIPRVWTYVFPPTESTLISLVNMSEEIDFAVFILGHDDLVLKSRTANPEGKGERVEGENWTTRDNVIFELGLLIGTLGKERCFAVLPEIPRDLEVNQPRCHLFTDYLGTNYCTYLATKEPGLDPLDAVFVACQEIGNQIDRLGQRPINAFRALFGFKKQAVVVYPHITAETHAIRTVVHGGGSVGGQQTFLWLTDPECKDDCHEVAHADDLRAVNAIAELCGRMEVNVIATRDDQEQAEVQSPETTSFSIGLQNGFTKQAMEIISHDTEGRIGLEFQPPKKTPQEPKPGEPVFRISVITFNGRTYPSGLTGDDRAAETTREDPNYAILVRTFLRSSGPAVLRFVCGGIEGPGTAVAGVYLKNHWRELLSYYLNFSKDLEQDSLAVLLRFWGQKAESARPEVVGLSFFNAFTCEFHVYDRKERKWKPQEASPLGIQSPQRAMEIVAPPQASDTGSPQADPTQAPGRPALRKRRESGPKR
jgi:predicted nucleotide-binding protein